MVSVSIMTILLAIAAPNYSSWMTNTQIRNAAENANIAITLARTTAIRTNSPTEITFSNNGAWVIKDSSNNLLGSSDLRTNNAKISLNTISKSCIAGGNQPPSTLTFNGSGSLTSYSEYELNFTSSNQRSSDTPFTVKVSPGGSSAICLTNGSINNPQSCSNIKGGC